MSRRTLFLFAAVSLLAGCVPVTEPLGDVEKAEPDRRLVGRWEQVGSPTDVYEIDAPAVKGNPKGLLRAAHKGADSFWFHTTAVGRHTYATIYLDQAKDGEFADFGTEGAFAKWQKGTNRRYFVFKFVLDGDTLDVDGGNDKAFKKLMADEKVGEADNYFKTPAGWLAKYLEKDGPEAIFDGSNVDHRKRAK
jgi:hypothetical protein